MEDHLTLYYSFLIFDSLVDCASVNSNTLQLNIFRKFANPPHPTLRVFIIIYTVSEHSHVCIILFEIKIYLNKLANNKYAFIYKQYK